MSTANGRNGNLPAGWSTVRLGDITTVCRRGRAPVYEGGTTLVINQKCIRSRTDIDLAFAKLTNEAVQPIPDWARLRPGDILVNSTGKGTLGRVGWLREQPDRITADTHVSVLRPFQERILPAFLGWYMHSLREHLEEMSTGSTNQRELRPSDLGDLAVPVPPRHEQERVVTFIETMLSQVDAGIASFASAARHGALYERAVLQQALGNCVVPVDGDEGSSALPELPGTWDWSTVAEEGVVQLGRMLNKDRSAGLHLKPYLRVANVLDDRLDLSDIKQMDFPPGEYERYQLHPGDILLNEGQSPELLGRAAMYRGERPELCFQKTLLRFQAGSRVDAEFALLVFRHYLYAGRFRRESRITTGIGHLTQVRFAAMEFPVPPRAEQEEIVREVRKQLDSADRFHKVVLKAQEDAAILKASLLNDAFSGGLSRQEPDDQQADALTATIGQAAMNGALTLGAGQLSPRNNASPVRAGE